MRETLTVLETFRVSAMRAHFGPSVQPSIGRFDPTDCCRLAIELGAGVTQSLVGRMASSPARTLGMPAATALHPCSTQCARVTLIIGRLTILLWGGLGTWGSPATFYFGTGSWASQGRRCLLLRARSHTRAIPPVGMAPACRNDEVHASSDHVMYATSSVGLRLTGEQDVLLVV